MLRFISVSKRGPSHLSRCGWMSSSHSYHLASKDWAKTTARPGKLNILTNNDFSRGGGGGESVGMCRGFAPGFSAYGRSFYPPQIWPCLLFYSDLVGSHFKSPPFSACRRSFCSQNWVNLSFYSDLVGSHFELWPTHPYWFLAGVSPPPGISLNIVSNYKQDTASLWCSMSYDIQWDKTYLYWNNFMHVSYL